VFKMIMTTADHIHNLSPPAKADKEPQSNLSSIHFLLQR
jgi:hypothetical protein